MAMKEKSFISNLFLILVLALSASQATAQERDTVFIIKEVHDTLWLPHPNEMQDIHTGPLPTTRYDRRVHRYRRRWAALIPTHSKLQFAFGFIPKYSSSKAKATFTVKQNYIPWSLQIKESRFSAEPLTCGIYLNTVFGEEFWVSEPDRYPEGYYGF